MPQQDTPEFIDWPPGGYTPTNGINDSDSEDSIDDTECADALNMLFERKQIFNRPGVRRIATVGPGAQAAFAAGLAGNGLNVLIDTAGIIYDLDEDGTAQAITPDMAPSFGLKGYHNVAVVNLVALFGNNVNGLIRWDPVGLTSTTIPDAPFRYVKGHLSRAVATVALDGSPGAALTFAWSVAGDETVWAGSTNGSGLEIISDANDSITGLDVMHNIVVIPRATGIHLAQPTGVALPAYNVSNFSNSSGSAGCFYDSTWASADNIAYFCSQDNVYSFNLQEIKPIGTNIKNKLFDLLEAGALVKGFITRNAVRGSNQIQNRVRYHLVVLDAATTTHFCYSVEQGTWSIHDYEGGMTAVLNLIQSPGPRIYGFCGVDESNPPVLKLWDGAVVCERASWLLGKEYYPEAASLDMQLQRCLIQTRNYGAATAPTISVGFRLNHTPITRSRGPIAVGSAANDGKWIRTWFDMLSAGNVAVGQGFQPRIDVPAGQKFAFNDFYMRFIEAGEYRGPAV